MRARPLTRPEPSACVTTPLTSLPAGSTTWPLTDTGERSVARTGCSTLLVSDATAVDRSIRSVVPEGIVPSLYCTTGAAGAEVAAEIGALVAVPLVAALSVAVVFSGTLAPLHAASARVNPITQAHFVIQNLHRLGPAPQPDRIASGQVWQPDDETGHKKSPDSVSVAQPCEISAAPGFW